MKFSHIEFLGTDQEVLDFTGAKAFDYETDYSNASLNVRLFGSHGKCNVPIGYHLVKDSDGALSVLTDEVSSYIADLEKKVGRYQTGMFDEIEKRDKKLTEALKHLKDLTYVVELGKNELATARILAEAKQFLSEVKK